MLRVLYLWRVRVSRITLDRVAATVRVQGVDERRAASYSFDLYNRGTAHQKAMRKPIIAAVS